MGQTVIISKKTYELLRRRNNEYLELQDRIKELITKFDSEDPKDSMLYSQASRRLVSAYYGIGVKDV